MAFQGCAFPCFADGFRAPSPLPGFPAGFFCVLAVRVKLPPRAMRRVSAKSPPSGGDLSAGGAYPSPFAHAGGMQPLSPP